MKIPIPNTTKAIIEIALPIGPVNLVTIVHSTLLIPSSEEEENDNSGAINIAAVKQNNKQICHALSEESLKFNIYVTPSLISKNLSPLIDYYR
jgi:hypothetical protein